MNINFLKYKIIKFTEGNKNNIPNEKFKLLVDDLSWFIKLCCGRFQFLLIN